MRISSLYIIVFLEVLIIFQANGQKDTNPPVAPELDLVTINVLTGNPELYWTLSPSPDVSGYVVYSWENNEGYVLDTLYNPLANSFIHYGSGAAWFSESYVVAALDSSGNISPLSNELGTIYTLPKIDTCLKKIDITWNRYSPDPVPVISYSLLYSINGGSFTEAAQVNADQTIFSLNDFTTDAQYIFIVRADLQDGRHSESNKASLLTKMQKPPQWINADFATISQDNKIILSFKIDPSSEITNFSLEKKTGPTGLFEEIKRFSSASGSIPFTDEDADTHKINYYRLAAVNNCNIPVIYSNVASNIVLSLEKMNDDIFLSWNPYQQWLGSVGSYIVLINSGSTFEERYNLSAVDTVFNFNYSDLMYEVSGNEICFKIKASETSNPYGENGESLSSQICSPVTEKINVPNTFTPDNNSINDLFIPKLSFTPVDYHLIITDIRRRQIFETSSFSEAWDGTGNGTPLPEGVYLWFLNVRTPSGRNISKSGTVTLVINR